MKIIKKSVDFSGWYTDVVLKADLADYSPVKGCMVIKPNGYAIWERVQEAFNVMMKSGGVENAYFPLFIPESLLNREKEHVEGFSPELAVVTIGGGKVLKERLVVRPTSETIMYEMYSRWIKSWRDLPILINQWNNVVRWEKRTYLFLRTMEFLWQEGHTVHETHQDALDMVSKALGWYKDLYQNFYGIDGISGVKSNAEKFAGAVMTTSYEMLMPDGKALQGGTSHDLGQNFAKVFCMNFSDREGKTSIPWQTSWGLSTRSIGALIMSHGDDNGLILPPKLAATQVIIVPIFKKSSKNITLLKFCENLKKSLKSSRAKVDSRSDQSVGWKFNEWELRGIPIRIEVGEKEYRSGKLVLVRRDTGARSLILSKNLDKAVERLLNTIQKDMFEKTSKFLRDNTHVVNDYSEFKKIMLTRRGFLKALWCGDAECESKIKEETKASTRCLPFNSKVEKGTCIYCGRKATQRWVFAQAY